MRPLKWLKQPKRLSDDALVYALQAVLVQLRCANHEDDEEAQTWLQGLAIAYLREIEARIEQGTLFD